MHIPLDISNMKFRLNKQYNNANKVLGQTGAGQTYKELWNNPKTQNIVSMYPVHVLLPFVTNAHSDGVIESFPWWQTLHGFWRTNPAFNTFFSVAGPGQNFEGQALALFKRGNPHSGASSAASANEETWSQCPTPIPDSAIDPSLRSPVLIPDSAIDLLL